MRFSKLAAAALMISCLPLLSVSAHSLRNLDAASYNEWLLLLHYQGGESVIEAGAPFFLSEMGHTDPLSELAATIEALLIAPDIQCRYPARAEFILSHTDITLEELPKASCSELENFLEQVPVDNISLVFAAEDNTNPSSMMGHTFLKLTGVDNNGSVREHAVSFFAVLSDNVFSQSLEYAEALFTGTRGAYFLSPYSLKTGEYLYAEGRSLWEFPLNLTAEGRTLIKKHLWELKGVALDYKLMSHHCGSGVESLLKLADSGFSYDDYPLFATPLEYLQYLSVTGRITAASLIPSPSGRKVIERYGVYNTLSSPPNSKAALSYGKDSVSLSFMPIYRDINSVSNGSALETGSKMFEVTASYNILDRTLNLDTLIFIESVLLVDYSAIGSSKYLKIALERREFFGKLAGVAELGRGLGLGGGGATVYLLPKAGVSYGELFNIYIALEGGFIVRMGERAKFRASYTRYLDYKEARGYKDKLSAYIAYAPNYNIDLFLSLEQFPLGKEYTAETGVNLYF